MTNVFWQKLSGLTAILAFYAPSTTAADAARIHEGQQKNSVPRNIILLISDGCGFNQVDAASLYEHGKAGVQVYEQFPFKAAMSTFSINKGEADELVTGSYDPVAAWSDPKYVIKGYTDSAAAATTMSTGQKTYDGAIGLGAEKEPLVHAWQRAERLGKSE